MSTNELGYVIQHNGRTHYDPIDVSINNATDVGLTIHGSALQTGDLQQWVDNDNNTLVAVRDNGQLYCTGGINSSRPVGSASIFLHASTEPLIEHDLSSNTASFDYTGGTHDYLMTDLDGVFQPSDVGNWIVIRTGTYKDARAEIDSYISSTQVVLHTLGWTNDINDFGYIIVTRPQCVIGDGNHFVYNTNTNGNFIIQSETDWIGTDYHPSLHNITMNSGTDERLASTISVVANGYSTVGQYTYLISGDLGPGKVCVANYSFVNASAAVSADSTTNIDCFVAGISNGTSATTKGFVALHGLTTAFQVYGDAEIDPDFGYEVTSGVVTDRVTGGTADTTAFLDSSASNVTIFDNDNDYILIGANLTFEVIDVLLTSVSDRTCEFTYEYTKGAGVYDTLSGVVDTTSGMQQNGAFTFTAPGDWAKDSEAEAPGDITNAYYIKITRTRNLLATPPVEAYFKTRVTRDAGMRIRGDGTLEMATMADAAVPNNSLYYSLTQGKLCYKDLSAAVNVLY